MTNDENTDWFKQGQDIAKAKELFQKAGYDGRPVVMLQATDSLSGQPAGLLAAQWLRQAGVNVELAAMDWGAVVTRRAVKKPPAEGGWNIFSTTVIGIRLRRSDRVRRPCGERREGLVRLAEGRAAREAARQMGAGADARGAQGDRQARCRRTAGTTCPHVILGQFFRNSRLAQERRRGVLGHAREWLRVLEHGATAAG